MSYRRTRFQLKERRELALKRRKRCRLHRSPSKKCRAENLNSLCPRRPRRRRSAVSGLASPNVFKKEDKGQKATFR